MSSIPVPIRRHAFTVVLNRAAISGARRPGRQGPSSDDSSSTVTAPPKLAHGDGFGVGTGGALVGHPDLLDRDPTVVAPSRNRTIQSPGSGFSADVNVNASMAVRSRLRIAVIRAAWTAGPFGRASPQQGEEDVTAVGGADDVGHVVSVDEPVRQSPRQDHHVAGESVAAQVAAPQVDKGRRSARAEATGRPAIAQHMSWRPWVQTR